MPDLTAKDKQYLWHPFTPMRLWLEGAPLVIERGEGVYLYDTQGNRYLDGVSALWCNVHGHNHPHLNAAIRAQLEKIAHTTMLGLSSPPAIELAERLVKLAPAGLERVFYSDSGATAVEIALKIAFQYWRNLGQPARQKFVAIRQSYHGDTLGAVSVGGISIFHHIFGALTFPALFCDSPHPYRFEGAKEECLRHCLGHLRQILEKQGKEVAAILLEPLVQGAAGIIVHPEGFLRGVRQLADEFGLLLIADEVATGFGRTGRMFACEHEAVRPDLMCLAKGITGGYLPLAATLATGPVFEAFLREPWINTTFYHGHTYTGNPLACAAAVASLEIFERERSLVHLPAKIELIARALGQMAGLDYVGDVRQCGMMAGIELVADKEDKLAFAPMDRVGAQVCQALQAQGVILRPLGDVIVIMPPLAINLEQLGALLDRVGETIASLRAVGGGVRID